jgi:hypothetical protein
VNDDHDCELFEAEVHRLKPAMPLEDFMARLVEAQPLPLAERKSAHRPMQGDGLRWLFRWLAPIAAAAAVVVALLVWLLPWLGNKLPIRLATSQSNPVLRADNVEIDRRLVAAFDAVAQMPDGEPMRFRCFEWADEVVLRDSARGIVVEQRAPRLEAVPVSFETY